MFDWVLNKGSSLHPFIRYTTSMLNFLPQLHWTCKHERKFEPAHTNTAKI